MSTMSLPLGLYVFCAVMMPAPDVRQVNDCAGGVNGVKLFEAVENDLTLLSLMVRLAQGMTERPAQKNSARRFHLFAVLPDNADTDGGDAGLFNNPLNQSHGLIADPSAGG